MVLDFLGLTTDHCQISGAIAFKEQHDALPVAQQYVRFAAEIPGANGEKLKLVVCMTLTMSLVLCLSKRLSIDTSFKRLDGFKEFEIEAFDNVSKKCEFLFLFQISSFLLKSNI